MNLARVIASESAVIPADPVFQAFPTDIIVLDIEADGTVSFTVREGKLCIEEGAANNATARATIARESLLMGIDGHFDFAGMFISDFKRMLKVSLGDIYDYGGDFMMLGPAVDALAQRYKANPAFKEAVDACKK